MMGSLGVMHPGNSMLKHSTGHPYPLCSCGASSATSWPGSASSTWSNSLFLSPLNSSPSRGFFGQSHGMLLSPTSSFGEGRVDRELFAGTWDGLRKKLGRGQWRGTREKRGAKAGCGEISRHGHMMMTVESQYVDFVARKTLKLPVRELIYTVDEYLQNVDRVVAITLPDSKRIQYIGNSTWRARLKPVEFFSVTATPICDMRAWYEDQSLRIFSDSLKLDFRDAGRSAEEFKLRLSLTGQLRPVRQRAPQPPLAAARASPTPPSASTTASGTPRASYGAPPLAAGPTRSSSNASTARNRGGSGVHYGNGERWEEGSRGVAVSSKLAAGVSLEGAVMLKLSLDLPLPLSLLPEPVVKAVGDNILERILSSLQASLLKGLLDDYAKWCGEKAKVVYPEAGRG